MAANSSRTINDESHYLYNMSHKHRGKCLIINNVDFPDPNYRRNGSDKDAEDMKAVFKQLGFEVIIERNKTKEEMKKLAERLASDDHSDSDCVAMFILSHGEEWDIVRGSDDEQLMLNDIYSPFSIAKTLVGKPKLFFVQACRGKQLDQGIETDCPSPTIDKPVVKIPQLADFLYAYSTPPGYYSFRRKEGSWFIQAIKKVFEEHGTTLEIQQLMTRVNNAVAYDYESKTADVNTTGMKQVSSCVSMLTKELYFKPKRLEN